MTSGLIWVIPIDLFILILESKDILQWNSSPQFLSEIFLQKKKKRKEEDNSDMQFFNSMNDVTASVVCPIKGKNMASTGSEKRWNQRKFSLTRYHGEKVMEYCPGFCSERCVMLRMIIFFIFFPAAVSITSCLIIKEPFWYWLLITVEQRWE